MAKIYATQLHVGDKFGFGDAVGPLTVTETKQEGHFFKVTATDSLRTHHVTFANGYQVTLLESYSVTVKRSIPEEAPTNNSTPRAAEYAAMLAAHLATHDIATTSVRAGGAGRPSELSTFDFDDAEWTYTVVVRRSTPAERA